MSVNGQIIKLLTQTLELLRAQMRETDAPEPTPLPEPMPQLKSKHPAGSMQWFRELQRTPRRRDPGIDAETMRREWERQRPRPPRKPSWASD